MYGSRKWGKGVGRRHAYLRDIQVFDPLKTNMFFIFYIKYIYDIGLFSAVFVPVISV